MRNPIKVITRGHTPLKLRSSVRRVRACPHPWSTLFFLIWPFPLRYSIPEPLLSVEEIEKHPDVLNERHSGIRKLYCIPIFRVRDTPLRSLYRLVEDVCASDFIMMGYECTYFFFHCESRWSLACIPDPEDKDPVRYALLASMVEALVDAFNWRLELGIRRDKSLDRSEQRSTNFTREEAPSWTSKVGPIEKPLTFREPGSSYITPEQHFLKRNVRMSNGYLYTV
ncbi:hypothetical protein MferCBS49748_007069 [Microsporum ferrugineum]